MVERFYMCSLLQHCGTKRWSKFYCVVWITGLSYKYHKPLSYIIVVALKWNGCSINVQMDEISNSIHVNSDGGVIVSMFKK